MIIADGVAFSPYIDKAYKISKYNKNINICLPDSFEWMILKSGVIKNKKIEEVINNTSEKIDITKYFSWEKFFTSFLEEITKNSELLKYDKKKIPSYYLKKLNMQKIAAVVGL